MDSSARSLLRAGSYPGVSLRLRAKVFLPAFPAVPTGPPTSVTAPIAHTPPAHRVCGPASQRRGAWSHEMRSLSARSLVPLRCSRWASSSLTAASAFVVPHWSHSPIKIARYHLRTHRVVPVSEGHWMGTSIRLVRGIVHPQAALMLGTMRALAMFTRISVQCY